MATKKRKYYVVWNGEKPGIYETWKDCEQQVKGFNGARFKSYETLEAAQQAFASPYETCIGQHEAKADGILYVDTDGITRVKEGSNNPPILNSLAVDAACRGNPGVMEYRGVHVESRRELFHFKTALGTNNIGEFLGIVHGLSFLKKHNLDNVLYSDSVNAINWVRLKQCKSKLPLNDKTAALWDYVHRAENWLKANDYATEIRKWDTDHWGEIPADFNRK